LKVQLLVIAVSRDDLATEGTYCELINRGSILGRRREYPLRCHGKTGSRNTQHRITANEIRTSDLIVRAVEVFPCLWRCGHYGIDAFDFYVGGIQSYDGRTDTII